METSHSYRRDRQQNTQKKKYQKNIDYQYSEREARPLKVTYFSTRQVFAEVIKSIDFFLPLGTSPWKYKLNRGLQNKTSLFSRRPLFHCPALGVGSVKRFCSNLSILARERPV